MKAAIISTIVIAVTGGLLFIGARNIESITAVLFGNSGREVTTKLFGKYGPLPEQVAAAADRSLTYEHTPSDLPSLYDSDIQTDLAEVVERQKQPDITFESIQKIIDSPWQLKVTADGRTLEEVVSDRPFTRDFVEHMLDDIRTLVARDQVATALPAANLIDSRVQRKVEASQSLMYPSVEAAELVLMVSLLDRFIPFADAPSYDLSVEDELNELLASGITMGLSVQRSEQLVTEYLEDVLVHNERAKEMVSLIKDREWKEGKLPPALPESLYELDYAIAEKASYEFDGKGILFTGALETYRIPDKIHNPKIIIEIDRYGDGGTSYLIETQLFENIPNFTHYEPYKVSGKHTYRYIVLPATETRETNYLNNIGPWHELIIP